MEFQKKIAAITAGMALFTGCENLEEPKGNSLDELSMFTKPEKVVSNNLAQLLAGLPDGYRPRHRDDKTRYEDLDKWVKKNLIGKYYECNLYVQKVSATSYTVFNSGKLFNNVKLYGADIVCDNPTTDLPDYDYYVVNQNIYRYLEQKSVSPPYQTHFDFMTLSKEQADYLVGLEKEIITIKGRIAFITFTGNGYPGASIGLDEIYINGEDYTDKIPDLKRRPGYPGGRNQRP